MTQKRSEPLPRAPLDLDTETFRAAGHRLVDELAQFFESIGERPVTRGEPAAGIRALLGTEELPAHGRPAEELTAEAVPLLRDHSLHNGHPRFFGYITSSAAPLGALADMLAAAMNPNVGLWTLSPVASEIETQTIAWLAELVGYPAPCGACAWSISRRAFGATRHRAPRRSSSSARPAT